MAESAVKAKKNTRQENINAFCGPLKERAQKFRSLTVKEQQRVMEGAMDIDSLALVKKPRAPRKKAEEVKVAEVETVSEEESEDEDVPVTPAPPAKKGPGRPKKVQ